MAKDYLGLVKGSAKESDEKSSLNKAQRREAFESPDSIILGRNDLEGVYDSSRMLVTTLGGKVRPITRDDLAAFRENVRTARSSFKGGISAKQIINLSTQDDRNKAGSEIHMVVPSTGTNNRIRFVTNAGPKSKDTRHFVNVKFESFQAAKESMMKTKKAVNWVRKQPLRFECDCGRFTFWYRYIATIGDFNSGRDETGFPKIRNPKLTGVACKHALRVMAEIERGGVVQKFLEKLIVRARANDSGHAQIRFSQKEADNAARGQKRRTEKGNAVNTSAYKKAERQRQLLAKGHAKAPKHQKAKRNSRKPQLKKMSDIDVKINELKSLGVGVSVLKDVRADLEKQLKGR